MRSTRRTGSAEKFWIVSAKILLLPTMVSTLSGVTIVVPKRPSSCTVPGDAADGDEVADLERPQHEHERAGGEIGEQPAPRRADREAGAREQRRERRRLDAEVAEDAEDQRDVERDRDDRAQVFVSVGSTLLRPIAAWIRPDRPISQRPTNQNAIAARILKPTSTSVVETNCWTTLMSFIGLPPSLLTRVQ